MKTEKLFIKVRIGSGELYSIETNIELPITGKYYYLPTSYKEPVRVYLVDYTNALSIDNEIMITATISYNNKLYDVTPNTLFNTKQKASEYYLQNYKKLDYKFLEGDKNEW